MLNVNSSLVCKCASDAQKRDEIIGLRDARSTRVHSDLASLTPLLFEISGEKIAKASSLGQGNPKIHTLFKTTPSILLPCLMPAVLF